ncbi:MAG: hypothetical protein ACO4CT_00595 [Planctomycetota bacterium]|jgi:hypothetical protein
MRIRSLQGAFVAFVLAVAPTACVGLDQDGSAEAASGQTPVQFSDIPVPDGMKLQQDLHQSHSFELGQFRVADLHYFGNLPVSEISDYLKARMPQHGWSLESESADPGARKLLFVRGRQKATCAIRLDEIGVTRMHVEVRVQDAG